MSNKTDDGTMMPVEMRIQGVRILFEMKSQEEEETTIF